MSNKRKAEHIELFVTDKQIERSGNYFDGIELVHRALPEISLQQVDTSCFFLGKRLAFPFVISSMTGGNTKQLIELNRVLSLAAEECQVAMGVGSQRIALSDSQAVESFELRKYAPTVPLIANIGAVQLNYGLQLEQVGEMISMLEADAIYLHFNPLQEVIQPEGDTDFSSLADKVQALVEAVDVPVIAKEVGCGFSLPDLMLLKQAGIRWIDVAGRGGTSWSRLENHRRQSKGLDDDLGIVFQDWGIPTPEVIRLVAQYPEFKVLASGGLRNGIDMVKSLILGADMCAMAAPLLECAKQGVEQTVEKIQQLQQEFRLGLFLLGCADIQQVKGNLKLIR
jgi:isopentenyl-diphosphate delta-isomerase